LESGGNVLKRGQFVTISKGTCGQQINGVYYSMNLNNENNMTVYVVMGGVNYEGENADTVKVFTNRENAVTYGESLVSFDYFDYYEIVATGVNNEG